MRSLDIIERLSKDTKKEIFENLMKITYFHIHYDPNYILIDFNI